MAYKNASDMKQASLRRVTPKRLGDFPVDDLTPEQRRENLIAALKSTKDGQEIRKITLELEALKTEIKRFKWRGRDLGNNIMAVIRSEVTKAQWNIWVKKAEELEMIREKLPENDIDELIKAGTCDDYNKILEAWNKHKSNKQD